MNILVITAVVMVIAKFLIHNIIKMLRNTKKGMCISENYRGKAIPSIGGIVFVPLLLLSILLLLISEVENSYSYISYLILILSMGFIGVIDDLIGDRKIKGLINHITYTLKGTMTTGFLKAFTGFAAACIINIGITSTYIEFIMNVLIISLFANTLNIFDLRPGRAVKIFLAISSMLLLAAAERLSEASPLLILNLLAWIFIRYDLKELCMLGDTGANILGITLGYYSILFMGFNSKLILLTFLILLNIVSERLSITEIIKNNKLLSYIDGIGREQNGNR